MMLCATCLALFATVRSKPAGTWSGAEPSSFRYQKLTYAWGGSHHIEPWSFVSAVESKCYICSTIFRDCSILQREQAWNFRIYYLFYNWTDKKINKWTSVYGLDFSIELVRPDQEITKTLVIECSGVFKILPSSGNQAPKLYCATAVVSQSLKAKMVLTDLYASANIAELSPNTSGFQCQTQVRKWLTNCVNSHKACAAPSGDPKIYPTRLLNISFRNDLYRLQDCEQEKPTGPYASLSHRWGDGMTSTLSTKTMKKLKEISSASELPLTFQHAIRIAKWLKIKYLWIDALCIVQDSESDWLRESAKMGDIYTHSYCNISATTASEEPGCFRDRVVSMVKPCAIPDPWPGKTEGYVVAYDDFWSNSLLDTPLHQRAWVMQERLLSPRNVHFGQEQIFWECRSHLACEAYPGGIPRQLINSRTQTWRLFDSLFSQEMAQESPRLNPSSLELHSIYRVWSKTIEQYMNCKMTFPRDKLVAIAGVAQKVAQATGESYLAGLWDNAELAIQLLWQVLSRRQSDNRPSYRSSSYRAPTWSWACLEAKVLWNWPTSYSKILIDVKHAVVQELAGYATSEVSSAELHIWGCLFPAELQIATPKSCGLLDEDGNYDLLIEYEESDDEFENITTVWQRIEGPVIHLDTPMAPASTSKIICLPICTDWSSAPGGASLRVVGLILEQDPNETTRPRYRRIGIFGLSDAEACDLCGLDIGESNKLDDILGSSIRQSITII